MAVNVDAKFEGKMTFAFRKGMRNLANFHQSILGSLNIGTLIESFYAKYKMYEFEIYRGVLCSDNEE